MRKIALLFSFVFLTMNCSWSAEGHVFGSTGQVDKPSSPVSEPVLLGEPNPPNWPASVKVLKPGDPDAQKTVDEIFRENGGHDPEFNGQWSESRYALLFEPGVHPIHVNVGYYTSVIGLGNTPHGTQIGEVTCENGSFVVDHGALSNFWRSAENFYTKPTQVWNGHVCTLWAVSQACPMRRVIVDGDLDLFEVNYPNQDAGYASGGFMADCTVNGTVASASQQQWISRNCYMNWAQGQGLWNIVFVGCPKAPPSHCGLHAPYTTVSATPVIAEKPYIVMDGQGKYSLVVPKVETDKTSVTSNFSLVDTFDFSQVYVATSTDDAGVINGKLAAGLHVVLTPGNYELTGSIVMNRAGACVLGIGFPTLISKAGKPCLVVGDVDAVRIAGVLLQAGPEPTETLLKWGSGEYECQDPGFLYDCYTRVGGTNDPSIQQMQADVMVQINSGNVVCDNLWLWRADHGIGNRKVVDSQNPCNTGFEVNGDHVTAYGLAG